MTTAIATPAAGADRAPRARPLRVLHVITSLGAGGAERALSHLARTMATDGIAAEVVCLTAGGRHAAELRAAGVHVVAPRRAGAIHLLPPLTAALRSARRADVIQGWLPHGNLVATLLAAAVRKPVLWNVRQSVYDLAYESSGTARLIRASASLSGRPVAIVYNSAVAARQHARLGFASERALVVHNGFDVAALRPDAELRRRVRAEWGIDDAAVVVGTVARFHPQKDFPNLLRAFAHARAADPALVLVGAGAGVDAGNAALAALLDTLALRPHVRLLGLRDDVGTVYSGLDVFCLPSMTEGFPNVVGEAMACALPCVATDVGATRELVGATGYVVPPRDAVALGAAIAEMARIGADARAALGAAARARVEREFDLGTVAARYAHLYRTVVTDDA